MREDVKMRAGDYIILTSLDDDSEEKQIITEVSYSKNEIKFRYDSNIEEEFSTPVSKFLTGIFNRDYYITEVLDYNSFLIAKLMPYTLLKLSETIYIHNDATEDEFLIDKGSTVYKQLMFALKEGANEITIEMPHFYYGDAIINGIKFVGFIDR